MPEQIISSDRVTEHFRRPRRGDITWYQEVISPIGKIILTSDGDSLTGCHQESPVRVGPSVEAAWKSDRAPFAQAVEQLEQYLEGERRVFEVPLAPSGTLFQLEVWAALIEVGYGQLASYGDIARVIGRPNAYRAVGTANGANPISIIIPCHRIIGSNGTLTGYGHGLPRKQLLLDLERGEPVTEALRAPFRRVPDQRRG